jgi:hypothetical protein
MGARVDGGARQPKAPSWAGSGMLVAILKF